MAGEVVARLLHMCLVELPSVIQGFVPDSTDQVASTHLQIELDPQQWLALVLAVR
jgi:hypothetical protein